MTQYEYKVIAAPTKGQKAPGVKTSEARFALAIEGLMNELAGDGWSYLRSDLLPSEERQGLTSSQTIYRSILVFYREIGAVAPAVAVAPVVAAPQPVRTAAPEPEPEVSEPSETPEPARSSSSAVNDVPDDPLNPR